MSAAAGAGGPPQLRRSHRARRGPSPVRRTAHHPPAHRRLLLFLAIGITLGPAAAPAGGQAREPAASGAPAVARWLGCYQLQPGDWRPAVDSAYELPPMVRLDSAIAPAASTRRRRWYSVRSEMPPFVARRPLLSVVGWRPVAADSVVIAWFDGFVRITAGLGVRGDSLAGSAHWRRVTARLDSAGRALPTAAARASLVAKPVACPP